MRKLQALPIISTDNHSSESKFYGVALIIAIIAILGFWLTIKFTEADLARDLRSWEEKLNLIAESRTSEVTGWISSHFKNLRSLAGNPSLQLYLSEAQSEKPDKDGQEPAARSYLRNLLIFTAEQNGFNSPSTAMVNANIQQDTKNGLAVLDKENRIIASTAMPPALSELIIAQSKALPRAKESLIDIQKSEEGTIYIGFSVPIFSIQGEHNEESQVGMLTGIKTVDANLYDLLKHPGVTENTLEAILVKAGDGKVHYLSPLQDGSSPLVKELSLDTQNFSDALLIANPGSFSGGKKDYKEKDVLATSRALPGTPWTLILKVDSQEALAEGTKRRAGTVILFFMIMAVIGLTIAAIWWHAHSKRSLFMSRHFRKMAAQSIAQENLLRLVTDHQGDPIYIIDSNYVFHFANQRAANLSKTTIEFMNGKQLSDVRGKERASYIQEHCERALKNKRIVYDIADIQNDKGDKTVRTSFIPLPHIPVASLPDPTPGVLIVEHDITEIVKERERRLHIQNHLIQTLVKLVDRRDPFAANHSLMVSQISHKVATHMELRPVIIETARIAGCLMNIGKILVPTELLTKSGSLTDDEKKIVSESMHIAPSILNDIDFDGPVADTLRQWQERWDGSGPLGLRGEETLVAARIIAVANAFIGMISPRSWRHAIPIESATKTLLEQADTHFDRRVVIALMNYVENRNGRAWLEQILKNHKTAA